MEFAILSFASLFAVVDPVGLIPTFLIMTPKNSPAERVRIAALASVATFIILFCCAVGGKFTLRLFGISIPAFEIAGGIILLLIALDMLRARRNEVRETPEEETEGAEKENIAITPLAMPMLAGPGAITTVILLAGQTANWADKFILAGNILLLSILSFFILYVVGVKARITSVIALKIATRLMGLLLASIAVQFILNGIQAAHLFN